ncbi:hypothetical protein [Streptococcus gallinaceus]|uniref:Uncharacterized protein n=1 Tax=Streptococcus gallinaceus TaxID=165758 RepID=A0ABV2JJZ1_9STRE
MKRTLLRNSLVTLTLAGSLLAATTMSQETVHAIGSGSRVDYYEYEGLQIIFSVKGTNALNRAEKRIGYHMQLKLKAGDTVSMQKITEYINLNLNNSVSGMPDCQYEYHFSKFKNPEPKISLEGRNKVGKLIRYEIPITDAGVQLPEYTEIGSLKFALNEEVYYTKTPRDQVKSVKLKASDVVSVEHKLQTTVVKNGIESENKLFEYGINENPFTYTVEAERPEKRQERTINVTMYGNGKNSTKIKSFPITSDKLVSMESIAKALYMQGKLQDKTGEHLRVTKVDMMDEDHYNVYVDRYSGDAISYEYYSQTNPIDESYSTTPYGPKGNDKGLTSEK